MPRKQLENPLGNFATAQRKSEKCLKKTGEERNRKERKEGGSRHHIPAKLRFHLVGSKI